MSQALARPLAALPAGIVDVWLIELDSEAVRAAAPLHALDEHERAQASRRRLDGRAWATAHAALRAILAGYLDTAPEELRFERTANGKPLLMGEPWLRFSLSRSHGLALAAVAGGREVGVDLEYENERTDVDLVAREMLPGALAAALAATPAARRRDAFFAAWVRHEALLKLRGEGLELAALRRTPASAGQALIRALSPRPGFAAAVAAAGGGWSVRRRTFPDAC